MGTNATGSHDHGPERTDRRADATRQLIRAMGPIEYLLFAVIALGIAVVLLLVIVDPSA